MKKNYLKIAFIVLLVCTSGKFLRAQCVAPSPPPVSGGTIAGCVSSAAFTLTGTPSGTNLIGWYANSYGGNALTTNSVFTTPPLTTGATYYVGQSTATSFNDTIALPTHSTILTTAQTRGFWFVSPVDFIITGLRVPVVIGGTVSGVAVLKLPASPPLYPSVTNSFTTLYLNQNITGTNVTSVNIPVYAGDIIGIMGERGGFGSYGPTTNPFTSTLGIGSTTVNLNRLGMLYDLAVSTPTDLWTETTNSIGRVEVIISQGCNSTLTPVTVSVVPVPQVSITPPPRVCANTSYTLSASGASTFTWTGGPQTSTYAVTPSSNTTYSVQGSILSSCTSSISVVTISVDPGIPILTATSSSSVVCSGNTLTLNGAGAPTYTWAGGANTVSNSAPFVPLSTQQYTLYGTNSCGTGSTMITVSVNPTPTLSTNASPFTVCDGHASTLTVNGASTYSWTGASGPGATFVVTPSSSGVYTVTGISSAGCPAQTVQVVVVVANPTVTAGAVLSKTLVCSGGSATLTSSGADTYSWTAGPPTSTAIVNPLTTQIYTVTGTSTVTQCYSTATIAVTVFSPTLTISANTMVCIGTPVTLTANAGPGSTYLWSNGSVFASANITVTGTNSYSVVAQTGTINGVTCSSNASVLVSVSPEPTVQIVSTRTTICKGEKTLLTASGGTTFVWSNLTPTTASVLVSPTNLSFPTAYVVTATDANGCVGTATISVKVNACTGISEAKQEQDGITVFPNPNNGNFKIQVTGNVTLLLVNQLGQVVQELSFNEENQYQQNIEQLSNGIYFLRGVQNNLNIECKLVVMR
jgi:hypothetical protein